MEADNQEILIAGARAFEVLLTGEQVKRIGEYLALLDKWSRKMNLTAVQGEQERVVKLVLDSLAVAPLLSEGMRVLDVGSGAGLPGIPVKLAVPGIIITLAESRRKRVDFLKEAVRKLGLTGVEVFAGRAEDYPGPGFDAVLVRAVGDLSSIIEAGAGRLSAGGIMAAMKGPEPEAEIAGAEARMRSAKIRIREIRRYALPEAAGSRSLVVLEKLR